MKARVLTRRVGCTLIALGLDVHVCLCLDEAGTRINSGEDKSRISAIQRLWRTPAPRGRESTRERINR
eukprot:5312230-Pyramimonas_sp.AAC.1